MKSQEKMLRKVNINDKNIVNQYMLISLDMIICCLGALSLLKDLRSYTV